MMTGLLCSGLVTAENTPPAAQGNDTAGAPRLTTIRVYYHDAAVLAERLNAMFNAEELKASGLGQDLILRASSASMLKEARALVADLDSKPAQFRISIRERTQQSGAHSGLDTSVGNGSRPASAPRQHDISVRYGSRNYSTGLGAEQTVTVLEGSSVSLTSGQLRPVQNVYVSNNGIVVGNASQKELVGSELLVTPTLAGPPEELRARVTVAVRRQRDAREARTLETFELLSTQLLPLATWTPLGGVSSRQAAEDELAFGSSYSTRRANMSGNYEIMIRLLP